MIEHDGFLIPDFNVDHVVTLSQQVGLCLMLIQGLEKAIAAYHVKVHKSDALLSPAEIECIYKKHDKMTLGQLFKEVKQCEQLSFELENRIEKFVEDRNWIIHHAMINNLYDIYNDEDFSKLFARIKSIGNDASELREIFIKSTEAYVIKKGIASPELISKLTQDQLDSLGKGR